MVLFALTNKRKDSSMENTKRYEEALALFIEARTALAEAQVAYDRERHTCRKSLYDLKEAGQRKMTEEQIRSESMVTCATVIAMYHRAVAHYEIAKEQLEFVKATLN
jgi:hypothetical protein